MQRYNLDRDKCLIVRDGLIIGAPHNWALYSAVEVEAEIARLKAEAEAELLKAALRWMTNCGAIKITDAGSYFYGNTAAGNIPPQLAAVIAEATK